MDFDGFPVREIILGAVALAGIYLAVMLLRLTQVGKRKTPAVELPPAGALPALADDEGEADEALTYARPAPAPPLAPPPTPAEDVRSFGAELGRSQLEREVRQLRDEIAALRKELGELKAAHRVSPQYADAMALVQRGLSAQDVADRCGISLAEAELVWALARGPQQFDEEDDHGTDPGRSHARSA